MLNTFSKPKIFICVIITLLLSIFIIFNPFKNSINPFKNSIKTFEKNNKKAFNLLRKRKVKKSITLFEKSINILQNLDIHKKEKAKLIKKMDENLWFSSLPYKNRVNFLMKLINLSKEYYSDDELFRFAWKILQRAKKFDNIKLYEVVINEFNAPNLAYYANLRTQYLKQASNRNLPKTINVQINIIKSDLSNNPFFTSYKIFEFIEKAYRSVAVKAIKDSTKPLDATLKISISGNAQGGYYTPQYGGKVQLLYTGSTISGKINYYYKNQVIEKTFHGHYSTPSKTYNFPQHERQAPFEGAFRNGNFLFQLFDIIFSQNGLNDFIHLYELRDINNNIIERYLSKKSLKEITPILEYSMKYGDSTMKKSTFKILGNIKNSEAIPFLLKFKKHPNVDIRYEVMKSLLKHQKQVELKEFIEALDDELQIAWEAAKALSIHFNKSFPAMRSNGKLFPNASNPYEDPKKWKSFIKEMNKENLTGEKMGDPIFSQLKSKISRTQYNHRD